MQVIHGFLGGVAWLAVGITAFVACLPEDSSAGSQESSQPKASQEDLADDARRMAAIRRPWTIAPMDGRDIQVKPDPGSRTLAIRGLLLDGWKSCWLEVPLIENEVFRVQHVASTDKHLLLSGSFDGSKRCSLVSASLDGEWSELKLVAKSVIKNWHADPNIAIAWHSGYPERVIAYSLDSQTVFYQSITSREPAFLANLSTTPSLKKLSFVRVDASWQTRDGKPSKAIVIEILSSHKELAPDQMIEVTPWARILDEDGDGTPQIIEIYP